MRILHNRIGLVGKYMGIRERLSGALLVCRDVRWDGKNGSGGACLAWVWFLMKIEAERTQSHRTQTFVLDLQSNPASRMDPQ